MANRFIYNNLIIIMLLSLIRPTIFSLSLFLISNQEYDRVKQISWQILGKNRFTSLSLPVVSPISLPCRNGYNIH